MLDKHIIDANASVRAFGALLGIDYQHIQAGDKVKIPAQFHEGGITYICFYKTNRGDRRFSVQGLKANAAAGDTIAITFKVTQQGETVLVINITNHAEMIQPEWEVAL
jgi:hypothetical protein